MIDVEALLAPISEESPSGESLRYSPVYDQIQEARRSDDLLDRGAWQREVKRADWDAVVKFAAEALAAKSKDLQIAAWLAEALAQTRALSGLALGLETVVGLLDRFWDSLYPEAEDGDLEFRAAPLEFLNDRLAILVKEAPLTDPALTAGYSYHAWQDSRQVGYESDTLDPYGSVDETKKNRRDELIADGKPTAEAFDQAVALSSPEFYLGLRRDLDRCLEGFARLDALVDQRFGKEAPRLSEFRRSLEECRRFVVKTLKDKGVETAPEPSAGEDEGRKTQDLCPTSQFLGPAGKGKG